MDTVKTNAYTPDLRGFIEYLEANHPEHVIRITKEVDPHFGVTGIIDRLEKDNQFPVVIFENVKGSKIPLVANMHADFERLRWSIGMEEGSVKEFLKEYKKREDNPIEPQIVESGPVQEVVKMGDDIDVNELPICTYHEKDAGKYITAGMELIRDPDTGVDNIGIYRLMVHDKKHFGIQISETAHGNYIWKKYEKLGKATPMAVIIGHHPGFFLGSLSFTPLESNELHVAGGILERPLQMVKCKTIPLEVPADAEIILECEILPDIRKEEAPFGEYPGTYGPMRMNPVVEVKAITHRKNPYYQNAFVGHPDNLLLSGLVRSTEIEEVVKIASPKVKGVCMPRSGRYRFICYVSIEKMIEGEAKQAAMAAFVADPFLKFVVVVDEDVDVYNETEVIHAIGTRVRGDHDIFMVPYAKGSPLDPASYDPAGGSHIVTKVGIDATRKDNYPDEISVPGADEINLADFIDGYKSPNEMMRRIYGTGHDLPR